MFKTKIFALFLPFLLVTSCQTTNNDEYLSLFKYSEYVCYSTITSSFFYDYVVKGELVKNKLDFIKDLSFNVDNNEDYFLLGTLTFVYKDDDIKNYFIGDNNKLYFNLENNTYSSSLNKYTSEEITNFLANNGERVLISELTLD